VGALPGVAEYSPWVSSIGRLLMSISSSLALLCFCEKMEVSMSFG